MKRVLGKGIAHKLYTDSFILALMLCFTCDCFLNPQSNLFCLVYLYVIIICLINAMKGS